MALRSWLVLPTFTQAASQPYSSTPSMPGSCSQGEPSGTGPLALLSQWNVPLQGFSTRLSQGQTSQTTGWGCLGPDLVSCMGSPETVAPPPYST
jgi:hypothetical protein